jgi:MFS family permease
VLARLRQTKDRYPRQFWIVFSGFLINAAGGSMVWPFLTIFLRQRLEVSLTTVTLLLTVNSIAGLVATSFAGPGVDRFGRKGAMVLSLFVGALTMTAMSFLATLEWWVVLMVINGLFSPLLRVGANSMVADMVGVEERAGAYALIRMGANFGVAIGPAVGGFVTSVSYSLAFYIAAFAQLVVAFLMILFVRETVPIQERITGRAADRGYRPILRDRRFLAFCAINTLAGLAYSMLMVLLPVYAKENFNVQEGQYGFIMTANAAMVVGLQYLVTRVTERYHHLPVLAVGSLFIAFGVGSVALGSTFPAFLLSMVVLTVGEMIMIPTSTALTANLAPEDKRGRYMGVYGLTWGIAFGIGPVFGGLLNDNLAPVATWYGGMGAGLAAALGFILLRRLLLARSRETV